MPQHLWHVFSTTRMRIRVCEVCDARQATVADAPPTWPSVSTICPGDNDADGARGRRRRKRPPPQPPRLLEELTT